MFGFYYHFTKNIDLKFMSNMSFYDDDQDNEIGPAGGKLNRPTT